MTTPIINFVDLTDEDLDNLSIITTQDVLDTNNRIIKSMSKRYKNIILAVKIVLFDTTA